MKAAIISTLLFGADALQPTKPAVSSRARRSFSAAAAARGSRNEAVEA